MVIYFVDRVATLQLVYLMLVWVLVVVVVVMCVSVW